MQSMLFKIIERIKKGGPNYRPLSVCEVRQGRNVLHCSSLKRGRPSRSCTFRQYVLQPLFFLFFCAIIFNFLFWYDFTHMYSMHSEYLF